MALQNTISIPPIDPNLFTGPTRTLGGVARTMQPTLGVPYGEFMRWIYVGTTGNLVFTKWDGTNETLVGITAGVWHPIYSTQIVSAGTTASNIVVGS